MCYHGVTCVTMVTHVTPWYVTPCNIIIILINRSLMWHSMKGTSRILFKTLDTFIVESMFDRSEIVRDHVRNENGWVKSTM